MHRAPQLEMRRFGAKQFLALASGEASLEELVGVPVAEGLRDMFCLDEVSPKALAHLRKLEDRPRWEDWLILVSREAQVAVGMAAYWGPPDQEGVVEISYSVVPAFEGRGFATEAARSLIRSAWTVPAVKRLRAHTREAEGASPHILTKCGFRCLGLVDRPDDRQLWRWERAHPSDMLPRTGRSSLFSSSFDERLAQRVRDQLASRPGISERMLLRTLAFTSASGLFACVAGESLLVRVEPASHEALLKEPGVRPMDRTGQKARGYLYIDPPGLATDEALAAWLDRCLSRADGSPPG